MGPDLCSVTQKSSHVSEPDDRQFPWQYAVGGVGAALIVIAVIVAVFVMRRKARYV